MSDPTPPSAASPARAPRSRRLLLVAAALVPLAAVSVAAAVVYWPRDLPPPLPPPRDPVLPDLVMRRLAEFNAGKGAESGRHYLYFTATVANAGAAPLLVRAVRAERRGRWRVSQRFDERGGGTSEVATPAELVWGGHGHEHWHVRVGASYRLESSTGRVLRRYEKVGFCFFDQQPSRAERRVSAAGRFPRDTCEGRERLELEMGLSPGWSDPYQWTLPDQRLDITGLPDGVYRIVADADPSRWFKESDESNNEAWAEIRLTTSADPPRVEVLHTGAHA